MTKEQLQKWAEDLPFEDRTAIKRFLFMLYEMSGELDEMIKK